MSQKPNHLIHETSVYLQQHAYNPVDWYAWGPEAFEKAAKEDKPIFLSIGYSTCHWCHVMEAESFEDEEVAAVLNAHFVSIKVDREQRPDIDAVYMRFCQMLTGSGGWPLTVLLTPDQKPFYAGTYFPKHTSFQMTGLMDLLYAVAEKWQSSREELLTSSEKITAALQSHYEKTSSTDSDAADASAIIAEAYQQLAQSYDAKLGGFSSAPKFPSPQNLLFLLHYFQLKKDEKALEMAEYTLVQMYRGGIFDHIGYGFCRYSTDRVWLVPHFEKMLYDNALLLICYLDLYWITKKELYKTVAEKIMTYLTREMQDATGLFYSAQDADSEGVEGKYYVFTPQEINALYSAEDAAYFVAYFDITEKGNFEGQNIPHLLKNDTYEKKDAKIDELTKDAYAFRLKRTALLTDDKFITSWNAMAICAFARAYRVLGDEQYLHIARRAQQAVEGSLTQPDGLLMATLRDGVASGNGHLDDYAYYLWALLELYEATFDTEYLEKSLSIFQKIEEQFADTSRGGYFLSGSKNEPLLIRIKELHDSAVPSGNSTLAVALQTLARITVHQTVQNASMRQLDFMAHHAQSYPAGYNFFNIALLKENTPSKEVIAVVAKEDLDATRALFHAHFLPNDTFLIKISDEVRLEKLLPYLTAYNRVDKNPTFYICQNKVCASPVTGYDELKKALLK